MCGGCWVGRGVGLLSAGVGLAEEGAKWEARVARRERAEGIVAVAAVFDGSWLWEEAGEGEGWLGSGWGRSRSDVV